MDPSTNSIRLAHWKTIIESCQARPEGISARQWLADNKVPEKQYYYWLRKVRRIACGEMTNSLPAFSGSRSVVAFAEIPVPAKDTSENNPSSLPAVTIRTRESTIEISTMVPDTLLVRLVKEVAHAL